MSENASINDTLAERGSRYGEFHGQARISQELKSYMACEEKWHSMAHYQREALEMIQHKISRILNGDPDYIDNWHDIAGYATLVENRLRELA